MKEYYVEFTFQSKLTKSVYLFPIFLRSLNFHDAIDLAQRTRIALEEHNTVFYHTLPKLKAKSFNADALKEMYSKKVSGKVVKMNVRVWKFKDFVPDTKVNFNENLKKLEESIVLKPQKIASTIQNGNFPVRMISQETWMDFEECLIIDVITQ